ncbi:hypothetical protein L1887_24542 [Cichorium endivia]|nr:hypothetical protein L1887_24542 [Cichorium endivia]
MVPYLIPTFTPFDISNCSLQRVQIHLPLCVPLRQTHAIPSFLPHLLSLHTSPCANKIHRNRFIFFHHLSASIGLLKVRKYRFQFIGD